MKVLQLTWDEYTSYKQDAFWKIKDNIIYISDKNLYIKVGAEDDSSSIEMYLSQYYVVEQTDWNTINGNPGIYIKQTSADNETAYVAYYYDGSTAYPLGSSSSTVISSATVANGILIF